jgi:hypothetical protein
MHHTQSEDRKARKEHKCTWCAQVIPVGETYVSWLTFEDGAAMPNKMHQECYDAASADGPFEYSPFDNERPERATVSGGTVDG